ncbi:hypothetical protein GCM10010909_16150 [Acidocella aquatica]|uniref:Uncharacterized protein n=1 Tax=Acidocella aquatica TaxID=1922313 RepID=A0ABQ6AA39_9PROT|nr:hypothetical protein [Acidocella aquatica]GLR66935.1 hypothetical protein GCM10010909_16150 [Acidocella aquatica]
MTGKNSSHDPFRQIANAWFGDPAIGPRLKSAVAEISKYAQDSKKFGAPAERKKKLGQAGAAAIKLLRHLGDIDPTTRRLLFGGGEIPAHPEATHTGLQAAGPALNADAVSKLVEFEGLLTEMAANASKLVAATPPQRAGAHELPDAVQFGVECLGSFWRKYRDDAPTSGQNRDSFGNFVEAVLCADPVNASSANIRTALRYFFEKHDHE